MNALELGTRIHKELERWFTDANIHYIPINPELPLYKHTGYFDKRAARAAHLERKRRRKRSGR